MTTSLLPTFYDLGLVSVESGQTAFTIIDGDPEGWVGDKLFLPSQPLVNEQRIVSVVDGVGELAFPWPGVTETEVPYELRYAGIIERSTARSRQVMEELQTVRAHGRGLFFLFDNSVDAGAPPSGRLRLNAADPTLATQGFISRFEADGGPASGELGAWGLGSSVIKGRLRVSALARPKVVHYYAVTEASLDSYSVVVFEHLNGAGSFIEGEALMAQFSEKGDQGESLTTGGEAADIAGLAAFAGEDDGFRVMVLDLAALGPVLSGRSGVVKKDGGDWPVIAIYTGPIGQEGPPPGLIGGSTTTLSPGSAATHDLVPVLGGYRLDLGLPAGATGDIDGVTLFWQSRITVDGNEAAARAGLGADNAANLITGLLSDARLSARLAAELDTTTPTTDSLADLASGWHHIVTTSGPEGLEGDFYVFVIRYDDANSARIAISKTSSKQMWLHTRSAGVDLGWERLHVVAGSNANGTFLQHPDGTMEVWREDTYTGVPITNLSGGIYYATPAPVRNMPATFVAAPSILTAASGSGPVWSTPSGLQSASQWPQAYPFSDSSRTLATLKMSYYAKGRWKA